MDLKLERIWIKDDLIHERFDRVLPSALWQIGKVISRPF